MNEIKVKKIKPYELTQRNIFSLNYGYQTTQDRFVVLYDFEQEVLLVNDEVPDEDIEKFKRVAGYDRAYMLDPECGLTEEIDYICDTYGEPAWSALFKVHKRRMEQRLNMRAEARAAELYKELPPLMRDEDTEDVFDERLIYKLCSLVRKTDIQTAENLVGYSNQCTFYAGYLMGKKKREREGV